MSNAFLIKTLGRKIWIAVRLALFGVVGFWISFFFSVMFLARVLGYDPAGINPFLSLPISFVGALMMLYGVGEWGRWAYLWVCLSIPISLFLVVLIPGTDEKETPVAVALLAAFGSYRLVRHYYALKARKHEQEVKAT